MIYKTFACVKLLLRQMFLSVQDEYLYPNGGTENSDFVDHGYSVQGR